MQQQFKANRTGNLKLRVSDKTAATRLLFRRRGDSDSRLLTGRGAEIFGNPRITQQHVREASAVHGTRRTLRGVCRFRLSNQ